MMETSDEINRWLHAGIEALKANERDLGRDWLLRVVEHDRENDRAWLWLSGALEDPDDQRLCLENVLSLDPGNEAAQRGLRLLEQKGVLPSEPAEERHATDEGAGDLEEIHVRKEVPAPSPAAAMLYPERQVKEWRYRQKQMDIRPVELGTATASSFDDAWSRDEPLCAYCAAPVQPSDRRCPQCGRKLAFQQFRYPKPSANMVVLSIMVFSLAQLFLLQGIYVLMTERSYVHVVGPGIITALLLAQAFALYTRRPWAHSATLVTLALLLAYFLLQPIVPFRLALLAIPGLDPSIAAVAKPITVILARVLRWFQIAAAAVGLFYAVWLTAPDFERVERRHLAVVRTGLTAADQYDATARRLARAGMWAAAVVHWQRAVALEPLRVQYQRPLAQAYARLGFMDRSLDLIASAIRLAGNPEVRRELEALQTDLKEQAEREIRSNTARQ